MVAGRWAGVGRGSRGRMDGDDAGMSLINQMLQELEQHRGGDSRRDALPRQVRAVSATELMPGKGRLWLLLTAAAVLAAVAGGMVLYGPRWGGGPVVKQPAPMPPAPMAIQPAPPPAVELQLSPALTEASQPPAPAAVPPPPAPASPQAKAEPPAPATPAAEREGMPPAERDKTPAQQPRIERGGEARGRAAALAGQKMVKQVTPQQQAEFHYQKALELLQQGRLSEAEASLGETLRLEPRHQAARQVWVGLLLEQKRYAPAEQSLREGLELAPDQAGFAMALARLQVERGNDRAAVETLRRSLVKTSDNADLRGFFALLLQRAGRHGEAIGHFKEALKISPESGNWWVGLGISCQEEKRLEEAESAFKRAILIEGLSPELQSFADQQIKAIQRQPGK
ncbi:MAG: tetratricopeptide repeat protein [Sulfuricella sp.]|nr:tetratricopeptide repeat protein [Sulfuricella sp.]